MVFTGRQPTRVFHRFRAPGAETSVDVEDAVLMSGGTGQLAVARAAAGLHQLCCEW